jgi:hypothetical protein
MNATTSMTTLSNSCHNTSCRTRYTRDELASMTYREFAGDASKSEKALLRKIRGKLCGIEGCTCGNGIGERA